MGPVALKMTDDRIACGLCEAKRPTNAIFKEITCDVIDQAHCSEYFGFHQPPQCEEVRVPEPRVGDDDQLDSPVDRWATFKALYPDREPANTDIWNAPVL